MKCFYCKQESDWLERKSSSMTDFEGRIIIIKNVPCLECECCGEQYFTNEVMRKEEELFEIAKKTMYDYVEMDYEDVAKRAYKLVKVQPQSQENVIERVAESTSNYGNKS